MDTPDRALSAMLADAPASRWLVALLALNFLYPILVCTIFFPTPFVDLREQINWGLTFLLHTWKHPPLQTWIAGVLALTGLRDAWFYMAVAQALNFGCLWYLMLIARRYIGPDAVVPVVVVFAASIYFPAALPTLALNADQIQPMLWAGALYHAMRAANEDRWRDWLLLALFLALATLAKDFAVVLAISLLVGAASVPAYRGVFGNHRLYAAALVGIVILLPYLMARFGQAGSLQYSAQPFDLLAPPGTRLKALGELLLPTTGFVLPVAAISPWPVMRGWVRLDRAPLDPNRRFLLIATAVIVALMVALILFAGLANRPRFAYAWLPFLAPLLLCVIRVRPAAIPFYVLWAIAIWVGTYLGTAVYGSLTLRAQLREPAPAAASIVRDDWNRRFACGPAYVAGEKDNAFALALYYRDRNGRPVIGFSQDDYERAHWIDKDALRRHGAIVIGSTPEFAATFIEEFSAWTGTVTLQLPYRRTWSDRRHTYYYAFIPPEAC
jgi:hypothetical protein